MSQITINELAILIVEPSSFQQKVISQELRDAGCTLIEVASDIASAFEQMRRYAPDLVVSAMYLSDGTGVDLINRMRADEALETVPFMLVSSEQRFDLLDPIRQAGSVAILPKPFRHEDLERGLQATLHFVDPDEMQLDDYEVESLQILLVDDSQLALKHISHSLRSLGISNITQANDGTKAIEALETNQFDLIITDFNMPQMDGEKLAQYVRQRSSQPYLPILMITSEQNETRLKGVRQAGVNAICSKPFDPEHIKALIKNLLHEDQ